MKRYGVLYLATFIILIPLDFLFLGFIAKDFFAGQVGEMLGPVRMLPAVLFYSLYVVGIMVFVNGAATATWRSALLLGALFGFFCYATFELTALAVLKHWTWPMVAVDISWGTFVTALSGALGLVIADRLSPR
ncbi:DUF2177 family protein [Rhodopseudomonas sp. NSM]|uniref:DUF2177 family protein n=1 Tax=Rhodopseudomonas sp. NSM TaxID=3457630 RepID=UPI00403675F5